MRFESNNRYNTFRSNAEHENLFQIVIRGEDFVIEALKMHIFSNNRFGQNAFFNP